MKTPAISVAMFVVAALAGALGQYLYKSGADAADRLGYFLNIRLWGGVVCYVSVMVLFIAAFRRGGSMTVLYPIYASTFIWAALFAWLAFSTPIKPVNVLGMVLIIGGMYLMGR